MLYSALALYQQIHLDELQQFRQWALSTPGHPEREIARGIENTSGPLGQGQPTHSVPAAAEKIPLEARFGP